MNGNIQENNIQKVDLEVLSRETIKPTSPTPHHLRRFNLSILDNIAFDLYTPLILFLPNTNKASVTDVITKRSKHLKEALSKILTQFYPLAGKLMDNLHIDCNDEGVYYKETRVNQGLKDFLSDPDDPKVRELMPGHPQTPESSVGNFLIGVQAQPVACSSSPCAPTRMEATTAVIWKAAAKAASTVRSFSPQSPYTLLPVVNLRKRASPRLPSESFGNLIFAAGAICLPERQPDLPTLMGELRESIAKLNTDYIESMKGEKGHKTFDSFLEYVNHLAEVTREGDCLFASSLLNTGIYELDFGWGKPIWFYVMNAGLCRLLHLNDTLKGGGVEAIVTLSPEEMEIFERDPELLSFVTANPMVYAPQTLSLKIAVWDALTNLISNWNRILVAMGDFNEVREASERFGSFFNDRQADVYHSFISNASLIDVPLGGYKFTWTDKWGSKMSKLDRFLVSESLYDTFPHITGVILEKGIPDHRPILIKEHVADFGPTPFRFFHSWLELKGFHRLVVDTWSNDDIVDANGFISFKKKLQNLKRAIRVWIAKYRSDSLNIKKEHLSRLSSIDIKIDQGIANETDFSNRHDSIHILEDLDKREASDVA
ncbi:RNA-directed DNA polymerase, eukaryota, reverse transcriptase zinc-binding domain protein [Tanacetum coccineum]